MRKFEESPRHARSSECAAVIVNLLAGDYPGGKAQLFTRIQALILEAMHQADDDLGEDKYRPSDN